MTRAPAEVCVSAPPTLAILSPWMMIVWFEELFHAIVEAIETNLVVPGRFWVGRRLRWRLLSQPLQKHEPDKAVKIRRLSIRIVRGTPVQQKSIDEDPQGDSPDDGKNVLDVGLIPKDQLSRHKHDRGKYDQPQESYDERDFRFFAHPMRPLFAQ